MPIKEMHINNGTNELMMKKRKIKGQQLYKKHALSVIMQAMRCQHPGIFVGKGLQLKWVVVEDEKL